MISRTPLQRFTVLHTDDSGASPEAYKVMAQEVIGNVQRLSPGQALMMNSEGRFEPRVTCQGRFEYHEAVVYNAVVRRHDDNEVWLVQQVQPSNRRDGAGRPDHLIAELAVLDPPPPLPDAVT